MRVDIEGGKYTYINEDGRSRVLRHGEPWNRDVSGDKFIFCMVAEIESLRQQLAAALAACKRKDDALQNCEGMLDELRDYPITHDAIIEALAIQPDDSALKAWVSQRIASTFRKMK